MKHSYRIVAAVLVLAAGLVTAACGASSTAKYSNTYSVSSAAAEPAAAAEMGEVAEMDMAADAGGVMSTAQGAQQITDPSRKLIRRIYLGVETLDFDGLNSSINEQISALGGYVEQSEVSGRSGYNGKGYSHGGTRYAHLVARIPKDKVDGFIQTVSELGNVTTRQESVEDITLDYVDVDSHKKALLIEQERLLALLEKAEAVEDIIALEQRLSDVRYQLESYESQLRTYDNQVDYSTVTLDINEVERVTPVEEKTVWSRMQTGFSESLYQIGEGCKDFAVGFVVNLPYLLIVAVIILVLVLILRAVTRKNRSKPSAPSNPPENLGQPKQ